MINFFIIVIKVFQSALQTNYTKSLKAIGFMCKWNHMHTYLFLSHLQNSLFFIVIQILWVKMDARRILQIPSNTLELCIKVTRRHNSFTNHSFTFSLFLLLHFDDFNVLLQTVSFSLGFYCIFVTYTHSRWGLVLKSRKKLARIVPAAEISEVVFCLDSYFTWGVVKRRVPYV